MPSPVPPARAAVRGPADPPPLSGPRKLVYGILLGTGLAVLLLAAMEGALRLVGWGHDPAFHRRAVTPDGEEVYRENRWVTAPYFTPELVRRPQPFRLPVEKSPAAYRIFVLGSSAAMGDPEPSFSIARVLEELLAAAYPEIHFEVVNAGITAVNSHVVRRIAADAAELAPDLFIVYEGHNEVIGPFGPATVFTPFLESPRLIRLLDTVRRTRLGQVTHAALQGRRGTEREWGGLQMFLDQQIAVDDPRLEVTRAAFRANLEAIVAAGRRAGARTLLCTVLSNQRDFAPFRSGHRAGLGAPELAEWEAHVEAGHAELAAGRVAAAERCYRLALAIDDQHADLTFRLARLVLSQRRTEEARVLFQRALDLDQLRFRTDSRLNAEIRRIEVAGAELVDLEAVAAAASAGGIIGDEWLLEHVHLSFSGTYLVARELFGRAGQDLLRRGRTPVVVRDALPVEEVRRRLGYTAYEQAMIIRELLDRFSRQPFVAQSDHGQRMHQMRTADAAAAARLVRPEARAGLTLLYREAIEADPDDWVLTRNAGMALVALGDPAGGLPYLERAAEWIDDDPPTLHALALALRRTGQDDRAMATFARLRELEPRYPGLPPTPPDGD